MKKILSVILVLGLVVSLAGCNFDIEKDATDIQKEETKKLMTEAQNQIGMPNINHFSERKLLKKVLEKCDDPNLITYLYTVNLEGKLVYQGRGIGFGVPYSVQYTNPQKIEDWTSGGGYAILPQADPSGLFKPDGLSATWYLMVDEETGENYVEYFEPDIIVKQTKAPKRLCAEWSLPEDY